MRPAREAEHDLRIGTHENRRAEKDEPAIDRKQPGDLIPQPRDEIGMCAQCLIGSDDILGSRDGRNLSPASAAKMSAQPCVARVIRGAHLV